MGDMTDYNAIERQRWGGPGPWAGKDSRTDAQKRDEAALVTEHEHDELADKTWMQLRQCTRTAI